VSFLELKSVKKTYPDGTEAVKGIDLSIGEGEFVVLLGPSGCGKTTTLRMIAGLEVPTAGKITLAGRDVTSSRPSERDVGFVFQFYALYPHMTVKENIAFPLRNMGMKGSELESAVATVADDLGVASLLRMYPPQLSGGDQQRVSLARAMARKPQVYLMDEPLGTLDADLRRKMRELIRGQQLASKVTTIYVTHDQEEAMALADRVVVMDSGSVRQVGTPGEVYDSPTELFVASFVGSPGMNLVPGTIESREGGSSFRPDCCEQHFELSRSAAPGKAVLGIRPEFVALDDSGPIEASVVLDEYQGSLSNLHMEAPFGRLVALASDRRRAASEKVRVSFDADHIRLFDPETGRSL